MKRFFTPRILIPAGAWAVVLAGLWLAVLRGVADARLQAVVILLAMLALVPMFMVPAALLDFPVVQRGLLLSLITDLSLLSLALLVIATPLGWHDALSACAVIAGWCVGMLGLARLLQFCGNGVAASVTLVVHSACYAALIVSPPLFRAQDVSWHEKSACAIGWLCPGLALQEATRPTLGFSWPQMDVMYSLTTLGQDISLSIPIWWHAAIAYAGAGIVMMVVGWGMKRLLKR